MSHQHSWQAIGNDAYWCSDCGSMQFPGGGVTAPSQLELVCTNPLCREETTERVPPVGPCKDPKVGSEMHCWVEK